MSSTTGTRIGSYADLSVPLDRLAGRADGHARRACLLGFAVGRELGFSTTQLADLLATILLKDLVPAQAPEPVGHGAILRLFERLQKAFGRLADPSMTAEESHTAEVDELARRLDLTPCVRKGLAHLREHWDGSGPQGLEANTIPLVAAIALVAETAEIAWAAQGADAAKSIVRRGSGKVFSPDVASAFDRAARYARYWTALDTPDLTAAVIALEPTNTAQPLDAATEAAIAGVANELSIRLLGLGGARPAGAGRTRRSGSRNRSAAA